MHQTYPSFPLTTIPPVTPLPPLAKQHVANEHPSFSYTYLKTSLDLVQFDKKGEFFWS